MRCRAARQWMVLFLEERLPLESASQLKRHLAICRDCSGSLSRHVALDAALDLTLRRGVRAPRDFVGETCRLAAKGALATKRPTADGSLRAPLFAALLIVGMLAGAPGALRLAQDLAARPPRGVVPKPRAGPPTLAVLRLPALAALPSRPGSAVLHTIEPCATFWKADAGVGRAGDPAEPTARTRPFGRPTAPPLLNARLNVTAAAFSESPIARISNVTGRALRQGIRTAGWRSADPQAPLAVADALRSGPDSVVALSFSGGLLVRINERSEVVPVAAPTRAQPWWRLRLSQGELWARVPAGGPGLRIDTPAGIVACADGDIDVRATDRLRTTLAVVAGHASFRNDQGAARAGAGALVAADVDSVPSPLVPSPDLKSSLQWAYNPLPPSAIGEPSPTPPPLPAG